MIPNRGSAIFRTFIACVTAFALMVPATTLIAIAADDDGGFARRFFVFWILRVFERGGDVFGDVQTLEDLEDQRFVFRTTRRVERGLAHLDLRR